MRIAVIGSGTRSKTLPRHLAERAAHGAIAARLVDPRLSAFAATPYERLVVDLGYVDAMQQAAREGCDAIFINSFADYGIDAARAAVDVPIAGAGAAAIEVASAGGTRDFAIVTVWPASMAFLYHERLRNVPGGERCVAIRHVSPEEELRRLGADDGIMERMARHEHGVIERLAQACDAVARESGAQAIALGCTCMAPIGPAVAGHCHVPVYESSRCGFDAAVAAARRGTTTAGGPRSTRTTLVPEIVGAWAGTLEPGRHGAGAGAGEGDCPVCVLAADEDVPSPDLPAGR